MNKIRKEYLLTKALGKPAAKNDFRSELVFFCPKCHHKKPKLSVNIKTDEYNCWTCESTLGKKTCGKTLTGLLYNKVSYDELSEYIESLDDLKNKNIVVDNNDVFIDKKVELPEEYRPILYSSNNEYKNYLNKRNVSNEDALFYRIGYCNSGAFSGRVIFPSFDENGDVNFFTGRKISKNIDGQNYMTCSSTKDIIFNDCLIDWTLPIIIVEGPFDMLSVGRNAIPLQGKTLRPSSKLFKKLVKSGSRVYVSLDKDAKGDQIAIEHMLYKYCVDVRGVYLNSFKDFGEMSRTEIFKALKSAKPYNQIERVKLLCELYT